MDVCVLISGSRFYLRATERIWIKFRVRYPGIDSNV